MIDSLNGYQAAMPQENSLILHMHELLQYLNRQGVSTFLTVAQHGLVGDMKAPVDVTYLADAVILLRYFEAAGSVRRAISVIKKRTGAHEDTIREFWIDGGLHVGEPLDRLPGRVARRALMLPGDRRAAAAAAQASDSRHPLAGSLRALILAPRGRDAAVAASLLEQAGVGSDACRDLPELVGRARRRRRRSC